MYVAMGRRISCVDIRRQLFLKLVLSFRLYTTSAHGAWVTGFRSFDPLSHLARPQESLFISAVECLCRVCEVRGVSPQYK